MNGRMSDVALVGCALALAVACTETPSQRALPYCDGDDLHRRDTNGVERVSVCDTCQDDGTVAECLASPVTACHADFCVDDGHAIQVCGSQGNVAEFARPCDEGTTCHDEDWTAVECRGCRPDECGGVCGDCNECGATCVEGTCEVSSCEDTRCGLDRCGHFCGQCDDARVCAQGHCVCREGTCGGTDGVACAAYDEAWCECADGACTCFPRCDGRACGSDGCGDSCGSCATGTTCVDGTCATLDLTSFTATHVESIEVLDRYSMTPEDPCWVDSDGDGVLDPQADAWLSSLFAYDVVRLLTGDRLLLLPASPTSPFDAVFAWARPGDAADEYVVVQTTAYGRPVPPVRLAASTLESGVLQTGVADVEVFDAAGLSEGSAPSYENAAYLQATYVPLRGASVQGTVTEEPNGPVLVDGTLKGTFHRVDLEHAVWLALAHCAMSGHGSGTCQDLSDNLYHWFGVLFWWETVPEMADADAAPFCAHITGRRVTVTGIDAP